MSNNQEIVFVEKEQGEYMQQGFIESNAISRVPTEIWVEIFKHEPKSRDLSNMRLVCKEWQAVIDGNFNMKVKLNEDTMDVSSIINFRVVHCNISKFCGEYSSLSQPIQLFRDPKILTSLNLRGPITKSNFVLVAQQCPAVKELSLTGLLLIGDSNIFEVVAIEEKDVLTKFMSGLQKLVVNGLSIVPTKTNPASVNLFTLLNWPMANLKSLVVRANFRDSASDKMFFDLLEKFCSLESVEFTYGSAICPSQIRSVVLVLPTLCTLNVQVKSGLLLQDWLPFIKAQNSIQHLKLVATNSAIDWDRSFENAILNNAKSLQSLELINLDYLVNRMSCKFLNKLSNLKSLIMHGKVTLVQGAFTRPKIEHLDFLPNTIETLVLQNFNCNRQEFEVISGRVANLRTRNIFF